MAKMTKAAAKTARAKTEGVQLNNATAHVQAQALADFEKAEFPPKTHLFFKGFTYPTQRGTNTQSNLKVQVTAPSAVSVQKGVDPRTFSTLTPNDTTAPQAHKLELLHKGLVDDVTLIRVPKHVRIVEPIRVTLSGTLDNGVRASFHHVFTVLEEGATASIILENTVTTAASTKNTELVFVSDVFEALVESNATLDVYNVNEPGKNVLLFSRRLAKPEKDARINWYSGVFGSKATNMVIQTQYTQPGASGKNLVAFFGQGHERLELWANALHQTHHTSNGIVCKGALSDHAESTFEGFVKIDKNAPGTVSAQSERVILLSETAWANAIPALVIENNDVQANHAAAVGQINDDQLYYLMARGLSKEEAFQMILEGYFEPILSEFPNQQTAQTVRDKINKRLSKSVTLAD